MRTNAPSIPGRIRGQNTNTRLVGLRQSLASSFPVGYATLRPPATIWQPFRLKSALAIPNLESAQTTPCLGEMSDGKSFCIL